MIPASEARKSSMAIVDARQTQLKAEIADAITEAVKKGDFEADVNFELNNELVEEFNDLGYKVKNRYDECTGHFWATIYW